MTEEIKRQQGHLVEVTGLVKRSSLDDRGIKIGGATIGGGPPVAGSRSTPSPAENVTVMDVSSVRMRAIVVHAAVGLSAISYQLSAKTSRSQSSDQALNGFG